MNNPNGFPPRISFKLDQSGLMIGDRQDTPEWRAYISMAEHEASLKEAVIEETARCIIICEEQKSEISSEKDELRRKLTVAIFAMQRAHDLIEPVHLSNAFDRTGNCLSVLEDALDELTSVTNKEPEQSGGET